MEKMLNSTLKTVYQIIPLKKTLFSFIKNFYIPSFYRLLRVRGIIDVEYKNSKHFKIFCDYNLFMENELFWLGFNKGWEKKSLALWVKLCENMNTVFDIELQNLSYLN